MPRSPEDSDTTDLGYFAVTEDDEDDIEILAEPWHRYKTAGDSRTFYPICIGEVLNQRYRIDHKLGHGHFSTVWMAYDLETKSDVAVKVLASGENSGEHEVDMQEEIRKSVQDTSHLVTSLATFILPVPAGKSSHRVLVFPLRGRSLGSIHVNRTLPMSTRMSAARQLLKALESLHSAGIVHRDLNSQNCMWGVEPLHHLNKAAKYKILGRPLKQIIPYVQLWKQGELVKPLVFPENLRTEDFYLGDFGLAMRLEGPATQGRPPSMYCSPERLHNKPPSFACDMWSYMCVFSVLYLGFVPFNTLSRGGIVSSMVLTLGPLPQEWKGLYVDPESSLDMWYDQNRKPAPEDSLEANIAYRRPESDPVERQHALSVLSRGFSYVPEERPTATQLLQDPSFIALVDKYC
ncbi:protein kinase [Histoplasma capsulatum G186AR]|uniref:Protein kinase n=2 Tax=Ajellomyces capsulatus TaxID=5037 RepID=C0NQD4_AJECG|nr:protein kinase [Histoplasma capsulatum G186AR]EEH06406.1 protein kinase [Histoplasma capsulatum G186AR]